MGVVLFRIRSLTFTSQAVKPAGLMERYHALPLPTISKAKRLHAR